MKWLVAILRAILEHWLNEWRHDRKLFWLESIGTCGSVMGTIILSVFVKAPPMLLAYAFWIVGSTLLMIGAYRRKATWFFTLMTFNTVMNIVAITLLVL
jgi:hypothetical protein